MHVFVAPMLSCCSERDKVAQRRGNEKAARGDTECQVARAAGLSAEHNVVVLFGFFVVVFFRCWLFLTLPLSDLLLLDAAGNKDVEMESQNPGTVAAALAAWD